MEQVVLIKRNDGGVSVMRMLPSADVTTELAKWDTAHPGERVSYRLIDISLIPTDRSFRDAWVDLRSASVDIDMIKCKQIHVGRIQKMVTENLSQLDEQLRIAEDNNDTAQVTAIRSQRVQIRALPQTFDLSSATTPDQLKLLWPANLGKPPVYS